MRSFENEDTYKRQRARASNYTRNLLLRLFIFNRDGNRCRICGGTDRLQIDHIISVYRGGKNEYSNFQTLCIHCNNKKAP